MTINHLPSKQTSVWFVTLDELNWAISRAALIFNVLAERLII